MASPAEMRDHIIERLVGDMGEPELVVAAARALAERALPDITAALEESLSLELTVEVAGIELSRLAAAKPDGLGWAMTVASSASSPDALVLNMDPAAVATIVGALFGGDPDTAVAPIDGPLSPTETEIATLVFEAVAKAVNGSGARTFDIRLPLPRAVTGAEIEKQFLRDGPGVRIDLAVSTPAGAGQVSVIMPQRVLLKHRGGTSQPAAASTIWRQRFSEEVMRSAVDLQATMPLARMTLGEIAALHEGQVIELDADAQTEARLSARQKTLFVCEFGKLGQNYTVRIRHPFDAGQELMDGLLPG